MNKVSSNPMTFTPVLKSVIEMDDDMVKSILNWAKFTFENKEKFKDESDVANYIKKNLEEKYRDKDVCWHVIVGRNFGGFLTFQEKLYIYFYIGQVGFLIFATVFFLNFSLMCNC